MKVYYVLHLFYLMAGADGKSGDSQNQRGRRGKPTVIRVPCGTVVRELVYDKVITTTTTTTTTTY